MASQKTVRIRQEKLTDALTQVLEQFEDEELEKAWEIIDQVADDAVRDLKQTSPKSPGGGTYAGGWTRTRRGQDSPVRVGQTAKVHKVTIYNEAKPQLTSLLERGHQTFNQYGGPFKRTPAHKHIRPVEKRANADLLRQLQQKL